MAPGLRQSLAQSPSAWWQSGYAADCKSAYAGSIPTQASIFQAGFQKVTRSSISRLLRNYFVGVVL